MQGFLFQSRGRRFLKKFGMALLWAALVGSGLAPDILLPGTGWHRWLFSPLERWERSLYDWRLSERALVAQRSEQLVVVAVDGETLAHGRESDDPDQAAQPWSRELVGRVILQLFSEGASAVVVDLLLEDLSPRSPRDRVTKDDEALFELLEKAPGPTVLAFRWDPEPPPSLGRPLRPWRVRVATAASEREALPHLRRILTVRHPAFLLREGDRFAAWAGVAAEAEGKAVARQLGVQGPPEVAEAGVDDRAAEWTPEDLLAGLSSVEVKGLLSSAALPRARSLQGPVSPLLGGPVRFGSAEIVADADGSVRALPHLARFEPADGRSRIVPSLAVATALALTGAKEISVENGWLRVGPYALPASPTGEALLVFDAPQSTRDARGTLKRAVSAWRVVENARDRAQGMPAHYDNGLEGKVVLLTRPGVTAPTSTPVGTFVAPVALHAQALANLLSGDGTSRVPPREELSWLYALAFLGAFVGLTFSGLARSGFGAVVYLGIVAAALAGWLLFTRSVFVHEHVWIRAAGPSLAFVTTVVLSTRYAIRTDEQVGRFVTGVLGRYVSPEVARQVTKDLSLVRPERRVLTVCFVDVDGFGTLAAETPPEDLQAMLGEFLSTTTEVIRRSAGQVDKYLGDAVMAFWGAPLRVEDHARVACETLLRLRKELEARQPEWERRFGHRLPFRVGLNTGEVVVGDLGTGFMSQYTVLGAAVNGAAALERLNRELGTTLLVGHATAEAAGEGFVFREVAVLPAHGGAGPVRAMEFVGRAADVDAARRARLETFAVGYAHLQAGRAAEALAALEQLESVDPVARHYAERLRWDAPHVAPKGGTSAA